MKERGKKTYRKSSLLYTVMISAWAVLFVFLWYELIPNIVNVPFDGRSEISIGIDIAAKVVLTLNGYFLSYFWLNGIKDLVYVLWFWKNKEKLLKSYYPVIETDVSFAKDRVLLLYCTCDDFDGESLNRSIKQDYKYFKTVILDDSKDEKYKQEIDEFAKKHELEVVRRKNRIGFKAGNINNYLLKAGVRGSYDYVVILDSDEVLPENFITDCLKYFYYYQNVGIVQANHLSTRNRNFFMRLFHIGVNSHWPTYQITKHKYGFASMLGHGAMIKRECYEQAGGFPPLVAEDLCLSIEARKAGYFTAFAPNIICEEEYPIDYIAFKKRHAKWTQGNLEFIKKYNKKIMNSDMSWFEKLDIILFTYNLPLTAVFATLILINLIVTPLLGIDLTRFYSPWTLIPSVLFFLSPMLNDFFTWTFKLNPFRFFSYCISVVVLYGSMLTVTLSATLLGIFGKKAKFIVTPKRTKKRGVLFALKAQWKELAFSAILIALAVVFAREGHTIEQLSSVWLIVITGIFSLPLVFFSNKKYTSEEVLSEDAYIREKTLKTNRTSLFLTEEVPKTG